MAAAVSTILATRRLVPCRWRLEDPSAARARLGDPEAMRFSDRCPLDAAGLAAGLEEATAEAEAPTPLGVWAVVPRGAAAPAGYPSLREGPRVGPGRVVLGLRLMPGLWGKGFAAEAARAALSRLPEARPEANAVALVDPGNAASVQWLRRLGFAQTVEVMFEGCDHPDHLYLLSPDGGANSCS
ncbi:MAG: GNAT family N-acetyltransferase [Pseudomonadota bacterium]